MNKKLLLILSLSLFTVYSFSQSLSLSYEGTVLTHNQEITIEGNISLGEIVGELAVTNNSSNAIDVKVKKVENYLIPETTNTFCWAGQCYAPNTYISPLSTSIPAGGTNENDFSGHYDAAGNPGQSSISYVFFDMNNPNDSVSVIIVFNGLLTGIDNTVAEVTLSNPYPNPAVNHVNFDYTTGTIKNAHISIYSLVGTMIRDVELTESNSTVNISTRDLADGFYFYRLYSGNQEVKTGKFVIRR